MNIPPNCGSQNCESEWNRSESRPSRRWSRDKIRQAQPEARCETTWTTRHLHARTGSQRVIIGAACALGRAKTSTRNAARVTRSAGRRSDLEVGRLRTVLYTASFGQDWSRRRAAQAGRRGTWNRAGCAVYGTCKAGAIGTL